MAATRRTTYLALGCWLVTVVGMVAYGPLDGLINVRGPWIESLPVVAMFILVGTVGAVLVWKRPGNAIGWLLTAMATGATLGNHAQLYGEFGVSAEYGPLPGAVWAAWAGAWLWPASILLLLFVILLFPDGKPPSRRWRSVVWAGAVACVLTLSPDFVAPGPIGDNRDYPLDNPVGIPGATQALRVATTVATVVLLAVLVATVVSLVLRARRSRGAERQQFKWLGAGGLFLVGSIAVGIVVDALRLQLPNALSNILFVLGISSIPLCIGVAVLRYRLYDIDALVNRTLVYAVLTATLGAVYLAMVLAMQGLLSAITPDTANSGVAVAASTLAAAALFQPARRRIQGFIDRRFYRRKYHAARTVEAFANRLRDEVDLETLSSDLVRVVGETMQPAGVSLWLRPTRSA